jgi:membrane associated rhomboid family serine protease
MRQTNFTTLFGRTCISGIGNGSCTLEETCSLPPFSFDANRPNQWYRFVFPIFLHGGIIHLLFNLSFQIKAGFQLERDIGSWRIGIIYMVSGVAGFIFGAPLSDQRTTTVGASGAIYGLIACLFLDLFQNWRLIKRPYVELAKMSLQISIAFLIGTLPYIDNLAHIGGFTSGMLCGIILMPKIYFGKGDRYRKYVLMALSIPILLVFCYLFANSFYTGENNCSWCKYFNCIPGMPWCDQKFAVSSIVKQN